jgi:hypothetical protein
VQKALLELDVHMGALEIRPVTEKTGPQGSGSYILRSSGLGLESSARIILSMQE